MPTFTRTTGDGDRIYVDPDNPDIEYPSVTTVLSTLAKPGLIPWAAKLTAEYAVDNSAAIAKLLDSGGREQALRRLKGARFADNRMATGTALHAHVEAYLLGQPAPAPPDEVDPAEVDALFSGFLDWERAFRPDYELVETRVCHPGFGYAGRLDLAARFPALGNRLIAIDIKTGGNVYPEVALQLAAYRRAREAWLDSGEKVPLPEITGGAALHIRPRRYGFLPVDTGRATFEAFLAALEAYGWRRHRSSSVIAPAAGDGEALARTFDALRWADELPPVADPWAGDDAGDEPPAREVSYRYEETPAEPAGAVMEPAEQPAEPVEPPAPPEPAEEPTEAPAEEPAEDKPKRKRADPEARAIRAWAIGKGLIPADKARGRLAGSVREAYYAERSAS